MNAPTAICCKTRRHPRAGSQQYSLSTSPRVSKVAYPVGCGNACSDGKSTDLDQAIVATESLFGIWRATVPDHMVSKWVHLPMRGPYIVDWRLQPQILERPRRLQTTELPLLDGYCQRPQMSINVQRKPMTVDDCPVRLESNPFQQITNFLIAFPPIPNTMDTEKQSNVVASHEEEQDRDEQLGHLANAEDHDTSKWQAIRRNPKAFAWCLFAVWACLLVSFENQAAGNILGIPQFRQDFGYAFDGTYVLSAKWQSAFSGAPIAS